MMAVIGMLAMSTLSFAASPLVWQRRHDVPLPVAQILRANIDMSSNCRCKWQKIDATMVPRIMQRYFACDASKGRSCEVFLVEGVPAAAMLYSVSDIDGTTLMVESFHLNKGLLLLFNVAPQMRSQLFKRHRRLRVRDAHNLDDFRSCP